MFEALKGLGFEIRETESDGKQLFSIEHPIDAAATLSIARYDRNEQVWSHHIGMVQYNLRFWKFIHKDPAKELLALIALNTPAEART